MLTIIAGPMFAGKTTYLVEFAKTLPEGSFLVFKPDIDSRFATDACVTHDGLSLQSQNLKSSAPHFPKLTAKIKTVLLDELNFFNFETLFPEIQKLLELNINIVGSGLLFDSQKKPFGATKRLSEMAHKFVELFAKCDGCGGKANQSYTKVIKTSQIALGAADSYGACCEKCWGKFNPKKISR